MCNYIRVSFSNGMLYFIMLYSIVKYMNTNRIDVLCCVVSALMLRFTKKY